VTRVVHADSFYIGGFLVCPDCGATRWQSGDCRCGVRLLGPTKRSRTLDRTRRTYLIDASGQALRIEPA
jgi:hypothetical protein